MRSGIVVFSSAIDTAKVAIAKKNAVPPNCRNTSLSVMTPSRGMIAIMPKADTDIGIELQIQRASAPPNTPSDIKPSRVVPSGIGTTALMAISTTAIATPITFFFKLASMYPSLN